MLATLAVLLFFVSCGYSRKEEYPFDMPKYLSPPYPWVKRVHLVYQTHLDVGFTGFAKSVCEIYFFHHLPQVMQTANTLAYMNRPERWLLMEFLDGGARCTNFTRTPQQIQQLETAIKKGHLTWHAKPFTMLAEVADDMLFADGIELSRELDKRFGQPQKITAAHKDVPGISKATVPIMAKKGVEAIHIGVNAAITPPALDSVFRWKVEGSELLVLLYGGREGYGYGGNITLNGLEDALVYNFTLDNTAPQTIETILEEYAVLKKQYPNAEIILSTLDDYVGAVKASHLYGLLPVFTGEMGNTWLYGTGADPFRVSSFREIRRIIRNFEKVHGKKEFVTQYNRRLMLIPEHNWGLSDSAYLDKTHYQVYWSNKEFQEHRNDSNYIYLEAGWAEKRNFLLEAGKFLREAGDGDPLAHKLASEIEDSLERIRSPKTPDTRAHSKLRVDHDQVSWTTESKMFPKIGISTSNGMINYLEDDKGRVWANETSPLSMFLYQTFTMEDFIHFNKYYTERCVSAENQLCADFAKLGMNNTYSIRADWLGTVQSITHNNTTDALTVVVRLSMPNITWSTFGAPRVIYLEYIFSNTKSEIAVTLSWFNKTATRLPEAMWLKFSPIVGDPHNWKMDVMGLEVSPYEVVVNGSRHLHSIWSGVSYGDSVNDIYVEIESLDANLVAPGDTDHLLNFEGSEQPKVEGGMHYNLYNNLWGTAFNQWYEDDAGFRFTLRFGKEAVATQEQRRKAYEWRVEQVDRDNS